MKKFIVLTILALSCLSVIADTIATNIPSNGVYLLSTNRAAVYSIEVSSTSPTTLYFYDVNSAAAPYYGTNVVNAAYITRTSSTVSWASNFVNAYGYTNWWTNYGIASATVTNAAATNRAPVMIGVVGAANTYVVYNTDALFSKGIAVHAPVATNAAIVINYTTGQ
jgi:hypothetical protein